MRSMRPLYSAPQPQRRRCFGQPCLGCGTTNPAPRRAAEVPLRQQLLALAAARGYPRVQVEVGDPERPALASLPGAAWWREAALELPIQDVLRLLEAAQEGVGGVAPSHLALAAGPAPVEEQAVVQATTACVAQDSRLVPGRLETPLRDEHQPTPRVQIRVTRTS